MLFTNDCLGLFFRYTCLYVTLLSFVLTSITPLYSDDEMTIDYINFAKKIENINKLVTKITKFNEYTSFKKLSTVMVCFKKYTEKELGRKISLDDLSFEVNKQMNALNIPINPAVVKSCLGKLLKPGKHKSLLPHNGSRNQEKVEFDGAPHIALGCVFIACAILVEAIGDAIPSLAAHCKEVAYTLVELGGGSIVNGSTQNETNRKSPI